MAVKNTTATTGLKSPVFPVGAWTVFKRHRYDAASSYQCFAAAAETGGGTNQNILQQNNVAASLIVAGNTASPAFGALVANRWHDMALVAASNANGAALTGYVGLTGSGTPMASGAGTLIAMIAPAAWLGQGTGGEACNGAHADVMVWSVALTAAELEQQRQSAVPCVRLDKLWAWIPARTPTDLWDESGSGRHFTTTATTIVDGPTRPRRVRRSARVVYAPAAGGGSALVHPVAEALGLTEAAPSVRGLLRRTAEALGLAEATRRLLGAVRVRSDAVGTTETTARPRHMVRRTLEALGIGEAVDAGLALLLVVAEDLGLTEAAGHVAGFVRRVGEAVGLTEGSRRLLGFVRRVSEAVGLTETLSKLLVAGGAALVRVRTEALAVAEASRRLLQLRRVQATAVGVTETPRRRGTWVRGVGETVGLTEPLRRAARFLRVRTEGVGVTEILRKLVPGTGVLLARVVVRQLVAATAAVRRRLSATATTEPGDEV